MNRESNHQKPGRQNLGLYLGLLTHKNSKFPKAPFDDLFDQASDIGKQLSFDVSSFISDENTYSVEDVTLVDLLLAKVYEPLLRRSWLCYLTNTKIRRFNRNNLRIAIGCFRYYLHLFNSEFRNSERIRYSRILNINAGYMCLLDNFLISDNEFGLIFEDDASFIPSSELVNEIFKLIAHADSLEYKTFFIDVSDSFSFKELGVEHLIENEIGSEARQNFYGSTIRKTSKPFSNTTCAVVYNREMALYLLQGITKLSLSKGKRITPMDWSLNLLLLNVAEVKTSVQSFHLDPGIFPQSSLQHIKHR